MGYYPLPAGTHRRASAMMHIVLFEPQIPPNTGNIIRLCANTGFFLHLIEPLGFAMDDKRLRRAGLDYRERQLVNIYPDWRRFIDTVKVNRVFAITTRGTTCYADIHYQPEDALIFGSETAGLPEQFLAALPPEQRLRIPMQAHNRSLNLSNAVAIAVYESWRQLGFPGSI